MPSMDEDGVPSMAWTSCLYQWRWHAEGASDLGPYTDGGWRAERRSDLAPISVKMACRTWFRLSTYAVGDGVPRLIRPVTCELE